MIDSRSGTVPVRLNVGAPSRRDLIRSGLIASVASLSIPAIAAPQTLEIPRFESGRYQFTIIRPPQELPSIRLFRLEGGTIELTALRGKPILLNFWASWCAACKTELPILERRYRDTWRDKLHVVAVSEDKSNRETIARFVEALDVKTIPIFLDPNGYVAYSDGDNNKNAPFALYGMPITYLISSSGSVIGYMPGAADWSTPEADELIGYLRDS